MSVVLAAAMLVFAGTLAPAFASAAIAGSEDFAMADDVPVELTSEGSARVSGVPFALNGFERLAKGTARPASGAPEGYRMPLADAANLVVVRTPEEVLVHVDGAAVRELGLPDFVEEDAVALWAMICALDEAHSMGGALLHDSRAPITFVPGDVHISGDYRYRFDARDASGARYLTVSLAQGEGGAGQDAPRAAGADLGDGVLWCDFAEMVPADRVVVDAKLTPASKFATFLASIDLRPFWVSLKTSGLALAISFVLGLLAAWRVMGASSRLKGALDSVFTIPMVLPPTVCGFLLLMLFGQSSGVGRWLIAHGVSLVFTWQAAVISATVVSFPLVYRTALGAFESLDSRMIDAARTLGWSEGTIFRKLMLPLAWPSIAAGTVLAFARAMGEFGCTLFFAGNYAGVTQTIPIAIYFEWMGGNTGAALFWVLVVIVFSFLVVWGINAYTARHQGYRAGAGRRHRFDWRWTPRAPRTRSGAFAGSCRQAGEHAGKTAVGDGAGDDPRDAGGDAMHIDLAALRELFEDGEA